MRSAETGSFTDAGRQMRLSASAVTKASHIWKSRWLQTLSPQYTQPVSDAEGCAASGKLPPNFLRNRAGSCRTCQFQDSTHGMLMMPTISNFMSYADLVPGISMRVGDAASIPKVLRGRRIIPSSHLFRQRRIARGEPRGICEISYRSFVKKWPPR
jgi:hypothetical protein